jgi:predicted RNase H-like HicB family nuclease
MKDLSYYRSLEYSFRVAPDPEGGFVASIPDLPGCYSFGETKEEAITKLDESKNLWLESYYEAHGDAPEPSREQEFSGRFLLRLPKYLHQRLHEDARAEGVSLNQYILSLLSERSTRAEMMRDSATQTFQKWLAAGSISFWEHIAFVGNSLLSATTQALQADRSRWLFVVWSGRKHADTSSRNLSAFWQSVPSQLG